MVFLNLILAAVVMYYGWPMSFLTLISIPFLAGIGWFVFNRYADPRKVTTVRMYRRSTRADGEPALVPQGSPVPQGVPPLNDRLVSQEPAR